MTETTPTTARRPRFNRTNPPAFRITGDDVEILRIIGRHRFLRSTHIAALVGRSLGRTNNRLSRLFHAGFVDRPRAQLDYYPTSGSAPMVYALGDLGGQLLLRRFGEELPGQELSRNNREAGRPFIEHQLEIVDFYVALKLAAKKRKDIRLIHSDELLGSFPSQTRSMRNPLAMKATLPNESAAYEVGIVPDLIFGIGFPDGSRRCFLVEIDRGTMPITRSDLSQSSYLRKMRAYLSAHSSGLHERQFGWRTFRVLTITTDRTRLSSMIEAIKETNEANGSPGAKLFLFASRADVLLSNPLSHSWLDASGRHTALA